NRSVGAITEYLWDFGDGSPADTTRNPSHIYGVGAFTVTLTVTGPGGTDTETKTDLITVLPKPEEPPPVEPPPPEDAPRADFVASDTVGVESLTVAFENRSVGAITEYLWDFGDGSPADTTRNPSHIYGVGAFTVRLTVTGPGGTDTETKTDLITVLPIPEEPPPENEPSLPLPVNHAPVVADIPDQTISYGGRFAPFDLNDYVRDAETSDAGIRWTCTGQVHVSVEIGADHIVRLKTLPDDWIGSEWIAFTATDAGGLSATDSMRATIRAPEMLKGDVNGDGLVDTTDVTRMADFILGVTPLDAHQRTAGDMNADGTIDLLDILEAIRRIRR
ncbi:MAG: PKD domain-containing protein, partial [Candidatus Latescibacteria bacterium]|nr:PKD domain-containing protein [Candidatus Latescibacterota bacterium]